MPAETSRLDSQKILTKRELEVCMRLADGQSVSDIANNLHLSEKTVYTHRQHIMDKLAVTTSVELAQVASLMGILH
jgi:two-component system invasion response regulator UvrY